MEYAEVNLQALQFILESNFLDTDLHKYENTVSNSNIRKDGGLSSVQPTIGPERRLRITAILQDIRVVGILQLIVCMFLQIGEGVDAQWHGFTLPILPDARWGNLARTHLGLPTQTQPPSFHSCLSPAAENTNQTLAERPAYYKKSRKINSNSQSMEISPASDSPSLPLPYARPGGSGGQLFENWKHWLLSSSCSMSDVSHCFSLGAVLQ